MRKQPDVIYWEQVWENVKLPQEQKKEKIPRINSILTKVLPAGDFTAVEIGCAPGKWLVYLYKTFGYKITGIEYAHHAYKKTIENHKMLDIPSKLFEVDLMQFESKPFDVVFSVGFIEHLSNVDAIIKKKISLCKKNGYVVTMIPGMSGLNWWISRTFRPKVANIHFPMTKKDLIDYHLTNGVDLIHCEYLSSFQITMPIDKNNFSINYPILTKLFNFPFKLWNKFISTLSILLW